MRQLEQSQTNISKVYMSSNQIHTNMTDAAGICSISHTLPMP